MTGRFDRDGYDLLIAIHTAREEKVVVPLKMYGQVRRADDCQQLLNDLKYHLRTLFCICVTIPGDSAAEGPSCHPGILHHLMLM